MKKLRAAVVGVGYLGTFHAQKYQKNPHVDLVGVFDRDPVQAEKVAKTLEVGVFDKLEDLGGKVDLVTVATSTQSHFEVADFLLRSGIHVNVEKPITAESGQAQGLIALARENKLKLTVGHIERFNPAFLKWRSMTKMTPYYLEFERMGPFKARGADVSVIHDLMIHDIDLLLSLKPGPIVDLQVQGARVLSKTIDWAAVWLSFASGLKVCMKASRVSPNPIRVMKSYDGSAQWTVSLGNGELERVSFQGNIETPLSVEKISVDKVDGLQTETDIFVDTVLHDKEPVISGEDGYAALELAERILTNIKYV